MAYGINRELDDTTVLVFDLGGGTFYVTLLDIDQDTFEVKATYGDTHLGGEDFDQRVMEYYIKKIQKSQGIDLSNNIRALQKLRKEVERVKRSLSSQTQTRLEIEDLVPGYDLTETLTRARFEELNSDLFRKTLEPVKEVLKNAKISKDDVDQIVLVGGSTRIPRIQSMLSEFFDGKELNKSIDPDMAVATGAAIQGGILRGDDDKTGTLDDMILLDVTPLSKGIETVGGVMSTIIPRDTTVPTKKSQVFSTNADNQSTVTISVYEGERAMTKNNRLLGKFELSGIPPAPRGVPQIEVTFEVDSNGILQVSAEDKGTGKAEKIVITADESRLSEEEIQRMVYEAHSHAEEDKRIKENIDARNGLESYLYNLRNSLDDISSISAEDKKELGDLIDGCLGWMEEHPDADTEDLKDKLKEVEQVSNPVMQKAYMGGGDGDEDDFGDDEL